ncbi:unnamed protein product [Trichobilharzia regenti]|uniref:Dynein light chain n=1 Tax=Trichobilharzia regenti TaxID=157069 RepID=A0A183VYR9_TRIRE|nr:unnamed protein product [Trichobilharzia regenti]VDQ01505.1 unnamed protein product [Trichobilharzia regenti]
MKEYQVTILSSEMSEDVETYACRAASEALSMETSYSGIAGYIKKAFDKKYKKTWHCIVGTNYCGAFSHETGNFIHFILDDLTFLLFRST